MTTTASTPLPAGFHTDDADDAQVRTYAGPPHVVPGRAAGAYAVVVLHADGEPADDFVTVELGDAEQQFTADQARTFARALTAAVDDLPGATNPAHPLDRFTVAEIAAEIVRRHDAVGGLLRLALAEADPATLTRQDRAALVDFLEKAMDARDGATDTVR